MFILEMRLYQIYSVLYIKVDYTDRNSNTM